MTDQQPKLARVTKPLHVTDLGRIALGDVGSIVGRLGDAAWSAFDAKKENAFPCFHSTRHIVHRFTSGNRTARDFYETASWKFWQNRLLPIMHDVAARYGYGRPEFPKAMFAKLAAGSMIDPHIDGAGSNLEAHKIHVPLATNPGAVFLAGTEEFHLAAGRAWEVNNIARHGAMNRGTTDRIHFIFELYDAAQQGEGSAG